MNYVVWVFFIFTDLLSTWTKSVLNYLLLVHFYFVSRILQFLLQRPLLGYLVRIHRWSMLVHPGLSSNLSFVLFCAFSLHFTLSCFQIKTGTFGQRC